MGTLFNQDPRENHIENYMRHVLTGLEIMGVKPKDATPDQWKTACEIVKAGLAIQNADILDEQLGGFGEILHSLIEVLRENVELLSASRTE